MTEDQLKECNSVLFRLSKSIECFWDFSEDMIIEPGIEISVIKKTIKKIYVELNWSEERKKGVCFGFVPCALSPKVEHRYIVEIWLISKPFCIWIQGGCTVDVKSIAKDLNMVAFDIDCGNRIYP